MFGSIYAETIQESEARRFQGGESIKVHVNQIEREYLEFLVARRADDIWQGCRLCKDLSSGGFRQSCSRHQDEFNKLRDLRRELQQAGS